MFVWHLKVHLCLTAASPVVCGDPWLAWYSVKVLQIKGEGLSLKFDFSFVLVVIC